MGVGGTPFSANQLLRVGVVFVAFLLVLIAIFTGWWAVKVEVNGRSTTAEAKPFDDGNPDNDDLNSEVIVTGVLAVFATVAVIGLLVVELLPMVGKTVLPIHRMIAVGAAVALGLAGILFTTFAWPPASGAEGRSFFDKESVSSGGGSVTVVWRGGMGWYFEIVGAILLPIVAFVMSVTGAGSSGTENWPPPAAPPPPAPPPPPMPMSPPGAHPASKTARKSQKK